MDTKRDHVRFRGRKGYPGTPDEINSRSIRIVCRAIPYRGSVILIVCGGPLSPGCIKTLPPGQSCWQFVADTSNMSPIDTPAISKGSTVLVTGANGFIGSHIADQFIKNGYRVRGTTRDPEKHAWIKNVLENTHGQGQFELVAVPDMQADGAFDDAVKGMHMILDFTSIHAASLSVIGVGVTAVVHTATTYSMDPNPHNVIPGTVAGVKNALMAAAKEPTVKRFVLTSSSASALIPRPNEEVTVTTDTWNEMIIKEAYRDPPYEPERAYPVYAASKTLAEKEAWRFVQENNPGFVLNTGKSSTEVGQALGGLMSINKFSRTSTSERRSIPRSKAILQHLAWSRSCSMAIPRRSRDYRLVCFTQHRLQDEPLLTVRRVLRGRSRHCHPPRRRGDPPRGQP